MRILFSVALLAMLSVFSLGCGKKDALEPTGGATAKLDGTYLIVGIEKDGNAMPMEMFTAKSENDRMIRIEGAKMFATKNGVEDSLELKLDSSKNPAHFTIVDTKTDEKNKTSVGIYKIDGEKLVICLADSDEDKDRPQDFKTTQNSKTVLMTLKKK